MINPFKEINWKPDREEIKKFGLTVFIGFAVISLLIMLCDRAGVRKFPSAFEISAALFVIGAIIFALSYFVSALAKPIYLIWFFAAACIGIVISNLILIFFFYLIFSPIGLLMRLSGRDSLKMKKAPDLSNWVACDRKADLRRYFRQY